MVFFPRGKGGGEGVKYGYKGKGTTNHLLTDSHGNPLNIITTAANEDERKQVLPLLNSIDEYVRKHLTSKGIPILEADKGYDCRALRYEILKFTIFPWIPYRKMGKKNKNSKPHLKKMRWKVERCIAWLQGKFRRIVMRYERKLEYWKGFLKMALIYFWIEKMTNIIR